MQNTTLNTHLVELESRLTFQEITIEELNQTVTAHELELGKLKNLVRLLIEKSRASQLPFSAPQTKETPPHY